jgi:NAD(P)-dependent dehydrogenase (short-subunit alcohol dehydrogenase family)
VADVAERTQVEAALRSLEERLGPPDVLVANAGMNILVKSHKFDTAKADSVLRVNLLGAIYAIGAVLPGMVERGRGHIVGVSSVAGFRGLPGMGPYSASKAGLSAFLESLRIDLAPRGIAVTTVHPGFVKTPMTDAAKAPLPFLVPLDRALVTILDGMARRKRRVDFPWPVVWGLSLARLLPSALWDWVGGLVNRKIPIEARRPDTGLPPPSPG